uniref:SURF1-like protein n=1 Tax=Plectus sambesii TaxID=2011161 RepID=A0A914XNE3_9BILA
MGGRQSLSWTARVGRRSGQDTVLELNATKVTGGGVKRPKRLELSFGSISMLTIPAVTFGLGCWQVKRLTWKLDLVDKLKHRTLANPVPFPIDDLSRLSELEYRPVTIRGEFLHDREFLISPRGRLDKSHVTEEHRRTAGSLISTDTSSHGAHVITPFRIANSDLVILVNRGWVPLSHVTAASRRVGQVEGIVTINAIVRGCEKRPQFVSENNPAAGTWYYRDVDAMAKQHSTAPIFVDATIGESVWRI